MSSNFERLERYEKEELRGRKGGGESKNGCYQKQRVGWDPNFFSQPTFKSWRTRLVRVRMVPSGAEKVGWGPSVTCLLHSNGRTTVGHFDFQAIISQLFSDQLLCSELNLLYNLKLKTASK